MLNEWGVQMAQSYHVGKQSNLSLTKEHLVIAPFVHARKIATGNEQL